jgi:hypothetical protein
VCYGSAETASKTVCTGKQLRGEITRSMVLGNACMQ